MLEFDWFVHHDSIAFVYTADIQPSNVILFMDGKYSASREVKFQ